MHVPMRLGEGIKQKKGKRGCPLEREKSGRGVGMANEQEKYVLRETERERLKETDKETERD